MLLLDLVDYFIIYATYISLIVFIYLFIGTFVGHFRFNYQCPWILKDEEISGIYPTLLLFYLIISFLISGFIIYITRNDKLFMAHSTFNYSFCHIQFSIFSTNVFENYFISDHYHLIILSTISMLFLLETYFSYNRYYGCIMVAEKFHSPSKLKIFLPYSIYILITFLLIYCTISMIPIIMVFLSGIHFIVNTYFSYFFYISVKISYSQVLKLHKDMEFMGDAYKQMKQQIRQIRYVYYSASIASLISAFVNCSFTLCGALRLIPFGLIINNLLLYLMFTKNKSFIKSTICCNCKKINNQLKEPFAILKKRKESPWARPSTLDNIKSRSAQSLKTLKGLPKQMTPNFIRTASSPFPSRKRQVM